MVQPRIDNHYQIIDLTSDDEDGEATDDEIGFYDAQSVREHVNDESEFEQLMHTPYQHSEIDHQEVIDLTAIPDVDVPPSNFTPLVVDDAVLTEDIEETQLISEAVCLQLVLGVFPDVSIDHVLMLIRANTTDQTRTNSHSEQIVTELLEGTYPKEADVASKKRRREDSDDVGDYDKDERDPGVLSYDTDA
jgi:TRIAD3 protein (E3 ubiquitin-protein ligase RNF216)